MNERVSPHERTWVEVVAASAALAVVLVGVTTLLTHVVAPRLLTHYERFPAMASAPRYPVSTKGRQADPVNVAIVGSMDELRTAMHDVGWVLADTLSHAADVAIAKSVVLDRPDSTAPVSSLLLYGRRQDMAFELQVGPSARRRHHIRLWLSPLRYEGRPVWLASASFDASAGISHRALRPTHHVAPDIDEERDTLEAALGRAGRLAQTFRVTGVGVRVDGHNADGDRFDTDGELRAMVLAPDAEHHAQPVDPGVPPLVAMKDRLWNWAHGRRG